MKSFVYCYHMSINELNTVTKAGYSNETSYDEDPFEIAKKLYNSGTVYVAISPPTLLEEIVNGEHCIVAISDNWFKQE